MCHPRGSRVKGFLVLVQLATMETHATTKCSASTLLHQYAALTVSVPHSQDPVLVT